MFTQDPDATANSGNVTFSAASIKTCNENAVVQNGPSMSPSTPKTPQTLLFKNALGVFQGGGCRGTALAGAYSAAVACGVHLSKVAGTSAGSLMAALIGAGASPEFVIKALTDVKFSNFMKVASGPKIKRTFGIRVLNFLIDLGSEEKWGRALRRGGMYTSEYIQEWVEELLVELLPDAKRPIKFQSLPKPTFIIAADLLSSSAKIWSKEATPEDSVALAVRASCSIPVFFQPVSLGNNRYVDGGMLSNSPTFVLLIETQIPKFKNQFWPLI